MPKRTLYNLARSTGPCVALVLAASGCDISSLGVPDDFDICKHNPEVVASVSLQPSSVTVRPGDVVVLQATRAQENGQTVFLCTPSPDWTSATPAVATISASELSGSVRALTVGTTVITVHSGGKSASATVTVSDAKIASLAIEPQSLVLRVGQEIRLGVSARDSAGNPFTIRSITWSGIPGAFATFTGSGLLTAHDTGTVTVQATVEGMSATARIQITRDPPAVRVSRISAGYMHSCAIAGGEGVSNGSAYCWGNNQWGQLGNGALADRWQPTRVDGSHVFTGISAGQGHTCAIASDGAAYCWGSNEAGQLGDGTRTRRLSPVRVATTLTFRDIAVVYTTSCGLVDNGAAYCWGQSLGSGTQVVAPSALPGGLRFAELIDGGWAFMCGRTIAGQVYCWGEIAGLVRATPTLMSGNILFNQADAGSMHVCGVSSGGASYCWGNVANGQLGLGAPQGDVTSPMLLQGAVGFGSIAAGGAFTCGLSSSGAYCFGQTGLTGTGGSVTAPHAIPDERHHPFATISAGGYHACAIDTTGGGWCWGRNYEGQLGSGEQLVKPTSPRQLLIR